MNRLYLALAFLLLIACGGGGGSEPSVGSSEDISNSKCGQQPVYSNPNAAAVVDLILCTPKDAVDHFESIQLVSTALFSDGPSGAANQLGLWSSDNENIATVSSNGLVTAIYPGSTVIRHKVAGIVESVSIRVDPIPRSLALSSDSNTVIKYQPFLVNAISDLSNDQRQQVNNYVEWLSSDESVAVVDDNGRVEGIASGTVSISASFGEFKETITLDVVTPNSAEIIVDSFTIDTSVSRTKPISLKLRYSDNVERDFTNAANWTVKEAPLYSYVDNGLLRFPSDINFTGEVTVSAEFKEFTGSIIINVKHPVSIALSIPSGVEKGDVLKAVASITYTNESQEDVSLFGDWSSTEPLIAEIDSTGLIRGLDEGITTIRFSHLENGMTVEMPLDVYTLKSPFVSLVEASHSFAAVREDGSAMSWGRSDYGDGDYSSVSMEINGAKKVVAIDSSDRAFAALREDGSVVTWGNANFGGADSSSVATQLNGTINVISITGSESAFAALREDGSVVTWGDEDEGGDSSLVANLLNGNPKVVSIETSGRAFAALREDGSVVTWGGSGGDSSPVAGELDGKIKVISIEGRHGNFAALREDGSVVAWGFNWNLSIDFSSVADDLNGTLKVVALSSNQRAFSALREDGSVVTWGEIKSGGDSSSVASLLNGSLKVVAIESSDGAFAALREDGSVVTWGDAYYGGSSGIVNGSTNVTSIVGSKYAFSALREDGSVVTWGNSYYGGDSSAVTGELNGTIAVVAIESSDGAFAALREDGSVVTWGLDYRGGDSSSVSEQLNGQINIVSIVGTQEAFAALREDGSVVTWGGIGDAYGSELLSPVFVPKYGMTPYSNDIDSDRDGINNASEAASCLQALPCLLLGSSDSDDDGVWDGIEINNNSDPLLKNTNVILEGKVTSDDGLIDANNDGYPDHFILPDRQMNVALGIN